MRRGPHDHILLPAGHVRPPAGDDPMNVQVTSRPAAQPAATSKLAIADGDIHPQRNSYKDLFPYMEARWVEMAKTSAPARARRTRRDRPIRRASRTPRAATPGRRRADARQQPGVPPETASRREQHPTRHPEPHRRQRRQLPEPRVRRRRGQCDEPMGRGRMADRSAPERLHRGAVRGRRCRGGRDRAWAGGPRFAQVLMVTRTANPPGQKQ